jgi:lipopolysaccharide export system protein LptC
MTLFGQDNLHSQAVTGLKIFLPLLGIAILSTLFLVSTSATRDESVPYANVDIAELLRQPRLTHPSYAGMTEDGAALSLTAREALPPVDGTEQGGLARDFSGVLETPDGVEARLSAGEVRLDPIAEQVVLTGGVGLVVSSGYNVSFATGTVALHETRISARGDVIALGPMGNLSADAMDLAPAEDSPGHYLMVFNGNVHLLYQP